MKSVEEKRDIVRRGFEAFGVSEHVEIVIGQSAELVQPSGGVRDHGLVDCCRCCPVVGPIPVTRIAGTAPVVDHDRPTVRELGHRSEEIGIHRDARRPAQLLTPGSVEGGGRSPNQTGESSLLREVAEQRSVGQCHHWFGAGLAGYEGDS